MATTPEPEAANTAEDVVEARFGGSPDFKLYIANIIGGLTGDSGVSTLTTLAGQQVSLHKGDPGDAGANELTAGAGVADYKRQDVTWTAATGGAGDAVATITVAAPGLTFNIAAADVGATITHFGVWHKATSKFLYGKPLSTTVTLGAPGKVTVTPTHSYGLKP